MDGAQSLEDRKRDLQHAEKPGYGLEHNYGHGHQHLANTLATLMMLAAIPASCGKAVPASFKWLPLDVFHPLGLFRALVQRAPATFWLRWVAGFCADQGMPGSHVDGSRRDARDQEAQDALR